jgi:hypothetical protein
MAIIITINAFIATIIAMGIAPSMAPVSDVSSADIALKSVLNVTLNNNN